MDMRYTRSCLHYNFLSSSITDSTTTYDLRRSHLRKATFHSPLWALQVSTVELFFHHGRLYELVHTAELELRFLRSCQPESLRDSDACWERTRSPRARQSRLCEWDENSGSRVSMSQSFAFADRPKKTDVQQRRGARSGLIGGTPSHLRTKAAYNYQNLCRTPSKPFPSIFFFFSVMDRTLCPLVTSEAWLQIYVIGTVFLCRKKPCCC